MTPTERRSDGKQPRRFEKKKNTGHIQSMEDGDQDDRLSTSSHGESESEDSKNASIDVKNRNSTCASQRRARRGYPRREVAPSFGLSVVVVRVRLSRAGLRDPTGEHVGTRDDGDEQPSVPAVQAVFSVLVGHDKDRDDADKPDEELAGL